MMQFGSWQLGDQIRERFLAISLILWIAASMVLSAWYSVFSGSSLPTSSPPTPAASDLGSWPSWGQPVAWLLLVAVAVCFTLAGSAVIGSGGKNLGAYRRILVASGECRRPYLETVALFVFGAAMLSWVALELSDNRRQVLILSLGLQWLLLLVPASLWLRGLSSAQIRAGLGWYAESLPREIACGLFAYLASMPILICGVLASAWVAQILGAPAYHPIAEHLAEARGPLLWLLWGTALVWAPVLEETIFRGALYHYLRARAGMVVSSLVPAVAFAGLHPQGPAGWPFLISLAFVLALTREWRGSLVASITMHFVHNAILLTLMTLLMR